MNYDDDIGRHARGRGGIRQRLAGHLQQDSVHRNSSKLGHMLLEQWAWGEISALQVQRTAEAALADGATHPQLTRLASLGASGVHKGNCHRDLLKYLDTYMEMPTTVHCRIPLVFDEGVQHVGLEVLPVHRMVAFMFKHFPDEWALRFTGGAGAVSEFWNNVREDDPKWEAWQGDLALRDYKNKCIPLALHGDGVPVFKGKSLHIVSVNSLLATGSSMDQKFYVSGYWEHLANRDRDNLADDTEDCLWRCVQWDLETLWAGTHPARDPEGMLWPRGSEEAKLAGTPLCNGFFAVPWIMKGDLDYYAKAMGLEHWSSHNPCLCCRVNRTDRPWTDFRLTGDVSVQWTDHDWRNCHKPLHRFFTILKCGLHSVAIDFMHCVSLGVAQHIGGNVLFELVWRAVPGGTQKEKLLEVWMGIKEFYSVHQVQSRAAKLTLSMFADKGAPHKSHPHLACKAKETEWLCRALSFVWPQYCDQRKEEHKHCSRALALLVDIYDLASLPGLFLSDEDATQFFVKVHDMQAHLTWLRQWAIANEQQRWNIVYKLHYLGHMAEQAQWLSPRAGSTYIDEDFMGRMKNVAKKCTGGSALYRLGNIILAKYRRGMFLRWSLRHSTGDSAYR